MPFFCLCTCWYCPSAIWREHHWGHVSPQFFCNFPASFSRSSFCRKKIFLSIRHVTHVNAVTKLCHCSKYMNIVTLWGERGGCCSKGMVSQPIFCDKSGQTHYFSQHRFIINQWWLKQGWLRKRFSRWPTCKFKIGNVTSPNGPKIHLLSSIYHSNW